MRGHKRAPSRSLRPLIGLIALAMLASVTPALGADSAEEMGDVDRGHALARDKCGSCHSIEPRGESPLKDAPTLRALAAKWPLEHLEEALAEGIVTGHEDMPVFVFEPGQIADLLAFLRSLKQDD